MFNVTVLKLKDIMKYSFGVLITIILLYFVTKVFSNTKNYTTNNKQIFQYNLTGCMDAIIPLAKNISKEETNTIKKDNKNFFEQILESQIGSIEDLQELKEEIPEVEEDIVLQEEPNTNENIIDMAKTGIATEVITNNPIPLSYNTEYGKVKIKNETSYTLTEDVLTPDITIDNKNILLFSSHTCESYTSSELYPYTPTGNYRTTDLNFTVARVAGEFSTYLKQYNYNVIHNTTYHDYPAYNGSYTRSLETVQNILATNPCDIIFDVHRDAIGSRSDYAPIVKIGDNDVAAQIMFVIGTNDRTALGILIGIKI